MLDSPVCPCEHDREDFQSLSFALSIILSIKSTMLNKIRYLISILLLYGAAELDLVTNCKVFDAAREFINSADRL